MLEGRKNALNAHGNEARSGRLIKQRIIWQRK